jgi:hypothetical protein
MKIAWSKVCDEGSCHYSTDRGGRPEDALSTDWWTCADRISGNQCDF